MTLPLSRRKFIEFMGACFTLPPFFKRDIPHERWSDDYDHHLPIYPEPTMTPPSCVVDYNNKKRNLHRRSVCAEGLNPLFVARAYIIDGDRLLVASYKVDEAKTRLSGNTVLDFTNSPFAYRTFRTWYVSILDAEGNSVGVIVPPGWSPEELKSPIDEWHPTGSQILETSDALASQASQLSGLNNRLNWPPNRVRS